MNVMEYQLQNTIDSKVSTNKRAYKGINNNNNNKYRKKRQVLMNCRYLLIHFYCYHLFIIEKMFPRTGYCYGRMSMYFYSKCNRFGISI